MIFSFPRSGVGMVSILLVSTLRRGNCHLVPTFRRGNGSMTLRVSNFANTL
ncbi:MAG: hypothetical protein HYZ34_11270 [Ignavibacteriae bacterium]|nr:hypothetical protein [Ignavibacteriota bacterium]